MRAQTIDVQQSTGRILCSTIFRPGGKKLLPKGHVLREEDVQLLATEGLAQVWVTELEEGEVGEDEAVAQVSAVVGCGSIEVRLAAGGRANLFATENCCVLIDQDLLSQINCAGNVVIATLPNFSYAQAGQRIATVKSTPFAVSQTGLEAVVAILHERGPLLQARPVRRPSVGVLYSDPLDGDRARSLFEGIMRQRLERFDTVASVSLSAVEEEGAMARAIGQILRARPTLVLVASTTAPAGPNDVVGQALERLGCHVERFLAPVEPGNLFLLNYKDDVPILSAPGCFRSNKPTVVDLVLPPLLARYRMSGWEVASLGHGGLLA